VTLQGFPVETFGSLNLIGDPEEVAFTAAIDGRDFDYDQPGRVRCRDGHAVSNLAVTAARQVQRMAAYYRANTFRFVVAQAGSIKLFENTGATLATQTTAGGAGDAIFGVVPFGTPGTERMYITSQSEGIYRLDNTTFTLAVSTIKPSVAAVTPNDNRLAVSGRDLGSGLKDSRVSFSDPGDPETFGANNFVELHPGDGEAIMQIVAWRDYLFVFKQSKFFVFYSTDTDQTGNPVFNYRTVDSGVGIPGRNAVCAGRDGVYFVDKTGVYRTTGGPPQLVSTPVDPVFRGNGSGFYTGGSIVSQFGFGSISLAAAGFFKERIYVSLATVGASANDITLVFDPRTEQWALWGFGMVAMAPWRRVALSNVDDVLYFATPAPNVATLGGLTDDGSSIQWRYRSGFSDLGQAGFEKTIRDTEITGKGEVGLAWSTDFNSPGASRSVSLGSTTGRKLHPTSAVGELLSFEVSGSGPGAVNRLVPFVRESRPAVPS
jgi:hypothetical protein